MQFMKTYLTTNEYIILPRHENKLKSTCLTTCKIFRIFLTVKYPTVRGKIVVCLICSNFGSKRSQMYPMQAYHSQYRNNSYHFL